MTAAALFLAPPARRSYGAAPLIALQALLVLAYVATGYAGLRLAFVGGSVTLFWPPSGLAFAALWLGGRRFMPAVAIGAFSINLLTAMPAGPAALVAFGNTVAPLAGAYLVRRTVERRPGAGELQRVFWFILLAVLGCTAISATMGTVAVLLIGGEGSSVQATWLVWWLGDAMGVLIVAPPILLWRRILAVEVGWRDVADVIGFAAAAAGIIAGLALLTNPIWAAELCKLFTLLLSLWAGARFGLNGPAAVTVLMAAGAVCVTALGLGPFLRGSFYDNFALVHSYLFAEAVAGMLLAAAIADLRRAVVRERLALAAVEAASAERIRMLAMISHDVRTPLSGIMAALQTLNRSGLPAEQAKLVDLASRAGTTITKLVAGVLDVARLEVGQGALAAVPFDPSLSLHQVVAINRHAADARRLALDLAIDTTLPAVVIGDPLRFEQLVGNLVTNALTYTEAGEVSVTAHWRDSLVVEVADSGPGLPSDIADYVAAPFEAGRPAQSLPGLKLGLSICRQLAAAMGGQIDYSGNAGGSRLTVTLPLPIGIFPPPANDARPTAEVPLRILLVEDDEITREATGALLASHGHDVLSVADRLAALAAVAQRPFDLALIDIQLADRPGTEIVPAIRETVPRNQAMRLVALTGDGNRDHHPAYLTAGFDGVLVKPLALDVGIGALVERACRAARSAKC